MATEAVGTAHMSNEALAAVTGFARQLSRLQRRLQLALLFLAIALIGGVSALLLLSGSVSDIERLGYPGVFLLSFLGSFAMVLPVPGLIAVCGAGGIELNPLVVGLLSGTGETIGEISGYGVGYGGRGVFENSRLRGVIDKLEVWMKRRGTLVLFLVSAIPNPVFDLVGIAAGGARYPVAKFFAIVFVGKTLKGVLVASTCFYGVTLMPWVN